MSLTAALQSLPHGPSFRFVDELLSLEPGHSATGTYLLRLTATSGGRSASRDVQIQVSSATDIAKANASAVHPSKTQGLIFLRFLVPRTT